MRPIPAAVALVLLAAVAAAAANRGVGVIPGDRVTGAIDPAGDTDSFLLPLTAGQKLSVQVVAAAGSPLLPDLTLLDPSGDEADLAGALRGAGRNRVSLRNYTVAETGNWALVVHGASSTQGGYAVTTRATVPRGSGRGLVVAAGGTLDLSVSGADGGLLAFSLKEKNGPPVAGVEVLDPSGDAVSIPPAALQRKGRKLEGRGIPLSGGRGIYVLRIRGAAGGATTLDAAVAVKVPKTAFRVINLGPEPVPAAVAPDNGRDGTAVSVTGTGFQPGALVFFGEDLAAGIAVGGPGSIACAAPATAASDRGDTVRVSVVNPDGQEAAVPGSFRYIGIPSPQASLPPVVPLAGGIRVTLVGGNFRPGFSLVVAGTPVPGAVLDPAGTISFTAFARAAGSVSVSVTDEFGRTGSLAGAFTYVPAPAATSASPASSSFTGGRAVTLAGTGFRTPDRVFVGGEEATPVTVLGASSLRFPMPAGVAGTFDVEVRDEFDQATLTPGLVRRRGPLVARTSTAVPAAPAGTDFFARRAALGDLDGDGAPDLVIATPYPGYDSTTYTSLPGSRILMNDGNGAFTDETANRQAAFPVPADFGQADAVAVGDLDGDGAAEVLLSLAGPLTYPAYTFTRAGKSYAYYFQGTYGPYQDYNTYPATRFLRNDGAGDLSDATASRMPAPTSTPVFRFGERWQAAASALGDLDGDGAADLVLSTTPVVLGTVAGSRYSTTTYITYLKEAYTYVPATRILLNASGNFSPVAGAFPAPTFSTGYYGPSIRDDSGGQSLALGDMDGDGDLDLVSARSYPRAVYVPKQGGGYSYYYVVATRPFANDGTGKFTAGNFAMPVPYGTGRTYSNEFWQGDAVALGDLDGDGDLDMVVGRNSFVYWYDTAAQATKVQPSLRVFRNNGIGVFSEATGTFLPDAAFKPGAGMVLGASSVTLGDLDGDRSLDLVLTSSYNGVYDYNGTGYGYYGLLPAGNVRATRVFLNDGKGKLADMTSAWLPAPSNGDYGQADTTVLGDLDGDGDLDLVLAGGFYPDIYGLTTGHNRPLRVFEND